MAYELMLRLPDRGSEPAARPLTGEERSRLEHFVADLLAGPSEGDQSSGHGSQSRTEGANTQAASDENSPRSVHLALPEPGQRRALDTPQGRIFLEGPRPPVAGLDLGIPEGLTEDQAARLVDAILESAARHGLLVYDPQVGRVVGPHDGSVVLLEWSRYNTYRLHTVGASADLLPGGAWYPEYEDSRSPIGTIWIVVGSLLLAALVLGRICG